MNGVLMGNARIVVEEARPKEVENNQNGFALNFFLLGTMDKINLNV
jgi:hypothetical protein